MVKTEKELKYEGGNNIEKWEGERVVVDQKVEGLYEKKKKTATRKEEKADMRPRQQQARWRREK